MHNLTKYNSSSPFFIVLQITWRIKASHSCDSEDGFDNCEPISTLENTWLQHGHRSLYVITAHTDIVSTGIDRGILSWSTGWTVHISRYTGDIQLSHVPVDSGILTWSTLWTVHISRYTSDIQSSHVPVDSGILTWSTVWTVHISRYTGDIQLSHVPVENNNGYIYR